MNSHFPPPNPETIRLGMGTLAAVYHWRGVYAHHSGTKGRQHINKEIGDRAMATTLEERVSALEAQVAHLLADKQAANPQVAWYERWKGAF